MATDPSTDPLQPAEFGVLDPAILKIVEAMARADAERDFRDRLEIRWVTVRGSVITR